MNLQSETDKPSIDKNTASTEQEVYKELSKNALLLEQQQKIHILLKRKRRLVKTINDLANFKEYILFQVQPNGKTEVFSGIKAGFYKFTLNGLPALHILDESYLRTMEYGHRSFRYWYCYAERLLPIGKDNEWDNITFERYSSQLIAAEEALKGNNFNWKWLLMAVGIIILIFIIYTFFFKKAPPPQVIIQNVTSITA